MAFMALPKSRLWGGKQGNACGSHRPRGLWVETQAVESASSRSRELENYRVGCTIGLLPPEQGRGDRSKHGGSMANKPIQTRPVSENENLLRTKFYESIAAQSDLMDKLSERLLTLELAIPGLFATVLKLTRGEKATLPVNTALNIAFACWLLALILTLIALTPKKWKVDVTILKQDSGKFSESLGIEDYFEQSALYKRRLITASSILFFIGIFSAVFTLG